MNATREAGDLKQDDPIHIGHQHEPGTPCYCKWDVDAIVDSRWWTTGWHREPLVAVEWHTETGTRGITFLDPGTKVEYLGDAQAAA